MRLAGAVPAGLPALPPSRTPAHAHAAAAHVLTCQPLIVPACLPACSYAQIYNEEITDLLAPGGSGLQIRDGDTHRGVYVEDLSDHAAVNGAGGQ